jgi:hypothetical protein
MSRTPVISIPVLGSFLQKTYKELWVGFRYLGKKKKKSESKKQKFWVGSSNQPVL